MDKQMKQEISDSVHELIKNARSSNDIFWLLEKSFDEWIEQVADEAARISL
jgi:hypothetical protein